MNQKTKDEETHRLKLEICNAILWTLASHGPMKLTQLTKKVELARTRLENHIRLLRRRNLVERQRLGKGETFYVATERGLKVLKIMNPIIKEAQKVQELQPRMPF
jgi:predicted transcriptional regulator